METVKLFISYNQLSIFLSKMKNPFNDWTEKHVLQGFAWRKGSVSFATIQDGKKDVHLNFSKSFSLHKSCLRAISMPFNVPLNDKVEIASISNGIQIELPHGEYQVVYQIVKEGKKMFYDISFIQDGSLKPEILKKDDLLEPKATLLMTAKSA